MRTNDVTTMWGYEFRRVSDGLSESDVAAFVEKLFSQNHEALEKLEHIASLHELAKRTVQEAEHLAIEIKEQAERESERRSAEVISKAEQVAEEITERTASEATAIEAESRKKARQTIADLDATLLDMKKWALEEFQALREIEGKTQLFLSYFETFLRLLGGESNWKEPKVASNPEDSVLEDQAIQSDAKEDIDNSESSEQDQADVEDAAHAGLDF